MRFLPCVLLLGLAAPAMADTVLATRTIRSQTMLLPGDLTVVEGDIVGAAISLDEVVGLEARVILYPGRPILLDQIGPAAIIERNEIISLVYQSGPLLIVAEGRSLSRAGVGDSVRALNLSSRKTVTGYVQENGTVAVPAAGRIN